MMQLFVKVRFILTYIKRMGGVPKRMGVPKTSIMTVLSRHANLAANFNVVD